MAKGEKLKLDKFDIDGELDFNFDLSDIDSKITPEAKAPKKRNPVTQVFKGTVGGVTDTLKDPHFIADVTRKSLPDSYGTVFNAADEIGQTASSLYDEAVKEIKPQLASISKKVDRLVPDEQKFLKKVTGKLANFFGSGDGAPAGPTKEQVQDQNINMALGSIFGQQQQLDQQAEARENADQKVRDHIDGKRFESNFGLLNSINEGIQRTASYTEKVNQAYQKKSLELQFRSYFVQQELLQATTRYFEVFKAQNEAITKNTALPEFVKINSSERFKDIARNKFFGSMQESLFGKESWVGQKLKKIKADGKQFIGGIKNSLENASAGLDGVAAMKEANQALIDAGAEPISKATMAGNVLGSMATNAAGNWLSKKAKPFLEKNKAVRDFGNKASTAAMNAGGLLNDWQYSDKFQENMYAPGIKGWATRAADKAIDYLRTPSVDMGIGNQSGIASQELGSIFNGRTQRSIVEIIPGYLQRILREISVMRTGDDNTPDVLFDHTNGKFVDKKSVAKSITKTLTDKVRTSGYSWYLDKAAEGAIKDKGYSEDQNRKVTGFFSQLSKIPDMNYTPQNIKNTRLFNELDADTQKIIEQHLDETITHGDEAEGINKLTKRMIDLKKATPDIRGEIELFIKSGYGEILEEEGIVTRDGNNNYKINEKRYFELLNEGATTKSDRNAKRGIRSVSSKGLMDLLKSKGGKPANEGPRSKIVKSDVTAKEGISSMEPHSALDAIKNTRIYKWFYKKGEGDTREHTGPMAQDVNRNMGEAAAPGGTTIDLTTMNGNTMAAIQALSEKQDKMIEGEQSAVFLRGIKADTEKIVELMQSSGSRRGGSGSDTSVNDEKFSTGGDYKSLFGNILKSTTSLLSKAGGDLAKSAKQTYTFTKDNVVKPGAKMASDAYDKYKDPVVAAFQRMLGKAGDMASRALDVGQDLVFNKMPKALQTASAMGKKIFEKLKDTFSRARDVYIAGRESPVLQATLMKAGYYRDQATGKIIENMYQLRQAAGNIVDPQGNVVLSIQDRAAGLFDNTGTRMKFGLQRLGQIAMGAVGRGLQRGKEFLKEALPVTGNLIKTGANMLEGASRRIGSWMAGMPIGGSFGFGNDKIYDVLVEMRDLMRGEKPPKHETKKDFKKYFVGPMPEKELNKRANQAVSTAKKAKDKLTEKTKGFFGSLKGKLLGHAPEGFMGPMPESFVSQAKNKVDELHGTAKEKMMGQHKSDEFVGPVKPGIVQQGKDKATTLLESIRDLLKKKDDQQFMGPPAPTTVTETVEPEGSSQPQQADLTPKYQSGKSSIDTAMGIGSKLLSFGKGALGKIGGAKTAMAGAKGLKGKALAGIGSFFAGSGKEEAAPAAETPKTPEQPKTLTEKAKEALSKGVEKAKTVTKTITGLPKGKAAFNDKDGSGRRDGAWQDRVEQLEKRKEKNKKDPLQADLQARYKSDQNIIDTIMQKAGGIFDLAKGGLSSVLSGAGDLMSGGKGMLGKLGKGALNFAKSPVKGTLGAIKAVGSGAMKALRTVGAPVARGLSAVGRIGAVGRVLSAGRMVQTAMTVGSLMTGGVGSAIMGAASMAMSGLAAVVSSPVVLGALAVGAVAYGGYKLYKYLTRNDATTFDQMRLYQYGFRTTQAKDIVSRVLALEEYLQDGRVGYDQGKAYLLDKKIDKEELINLVKIEKEDTEGVDRFKGWFENRFKPFFLTSLTALYSVDNKATLSKVDKLKPEQLLKYMELAKFPGGPYGYSNGPFKDTENLDVDRDAILRIIDGTIKTIRDAVDKGKNQKKPTEPPKDAKTAKPTAPPVKAPVVETKKPDLPQTQVDKAAEAKKDLDKKLQDSGEGDGVKKDGKPSAVEASGKAGSSKVMMAGGPLRDGSGASQYLDLQPGVKLDSANPALLKNFMAMVQEYGETTGKKVLVTSGTRTTAEQEALYRKNPKKAARPGKSLHEFGLALDVNSPDLDALDDSGLMRKYGFTRPVGGEPWHMEPAGIQVNLARSREDSGFAEQAVQASLFKGGGGLGSIEGLDKSYLGKRDPAMAVQLLQGENVQMAKTTDKDKAVDKLALAPVKEAEKAAKAEPPKATAEAKPAPKAANDEKMSAPPTQVAKAEPEKKPDSMATQINQSEKYSKTVNLPEVEPKPDVKLASSTGPDQPKDPTNREEVKKSIEKIAEKQNTEPKMMTAFAAVESSLNPFAKASSSSASGLYQFTRATWNEQMAKNARKYDLDPSTSPTDVRASTLMATEYIKANKRALSSVKSDPTLTDIYLAHFLGPSGARKFLAADSGDIAARVMPDAAKANPSIFYEGGRPLTVGEVYKKLDGKLAITAKSFGINVAPSEPPKSKREPAGEAPAVNEKLASMGAGSGNGTTLAGTQPGPVTIGKDGTVTRTESPDAGTRSAQISTLPQRPRNIFTPQQSTVLASKDLSQGMRGMATGTGDMSQVSSTLEQSLDVQKQMLEVLNSIAEKVGPEQFKGLTEALMTKTEGSTQQSASTPQRTAAFGSMSPVKSAIDLSRKTA